jgi:hypothetical protein
MAKTMDEKVKSQSWLQPSMTVYPLTLVTTFWWGVFIL